MPVQVAAVPAQTPFGLQNIAGGTSPSSVAPSQSSSRPLQISAPAKSQAYSHPFIGFMSRSTNPGRHATSVHTPIEQPGTAFGNVQTRPQMPQLRGSLIRLKP